MNGRIENRTENRKHQSMEAGGWEHPDTVRVPTRDKAGSKEIGQAIINSQELKEEMRRVAFHPPICS